MSQEESKGKNLNQTIEEVDDESQYFDKSDSNNSHSFYRMLSGGDREFWSDKSLSPKQGSSGSSMSRQPKGLKQLSMSCYVEKDKETEFGLQTKGKFLRRKF